MPRLAAVGCEPALNRFRIGELDEKSLRGKELSRQLTVLRDGNIRGISPWKLTWKSGFASGPTSCGKIAAGQRVVRRNSGTARSKS
jgi:hypothetical protein